MPAPLVRNAGSPTLSAGLSSRLSRRSREHADHGDAGADHVERQAHRRPLEVGAGADRVLLRHEDGVVGHAVELDLELLARVGQRSRSAPMTCGVERIE